MRAGGTVGWWRRRHAGAPHLATRASAGRQVLVELGVIETVHADHVVTDGVTAGWRLQAGAEVDRLVLTYNTNTALKNTRLRTIM